jgi:hypothetical protein
MTVKWYGHNNTRHFTRVKPEMSGCKVWPVGGRGGHCFVYKDGRYGHSNCMAHYEQVLGTEVLELLDLTLVKTVPYLKFYTQDDIFPLYASPIRAMSDDRFDDVGRVVVK